MTGLIVVLVALALMVLFAVAAPKLGADSRPTGLKRWTDEADRVRPVRF